MGAQQGKDAESGQRDAEHRRWPGSDKGVAGTGKEGRFGGQGGLEQAPVAQRLY